MSRLEQAPVSHASHPLTHGGLLALPGARRAFVAAGLALTGVAVSRAGTTTPLPTGAAVLACAALAVLGRRSVFDAATPPPDQPPRTPLADDRR
jgi:hypothetical protein